MAKRKKKIVKRKAVAKKATAKAKKVKKAKKKVVVKAKKKVVKPKAKKKVAVKKPTKRTTKKKLVAKLPKERNPLRKMKDGSFRLFGWVVNNTPTDKFPDLVTVSSNKLKSVKRFISMEKAVKFVSEFEAENLITSGEKKVKNELNAVGLRASSEPELVDEPAKVDGKDDFAEE